MVNLFCSASMVIIIFIRFPVYFNSSDCQRGIAVETGMGNAHALPPALCTDWGSCEAIIPGLFCIFRIVSGGRLFAQTLTMKGAIGCQTPCIFTGNCEEKDFADGAIDE